MTSSNIIHFSNDPIKIGVIVERRYLGQNLPGAVIRALKARDVATDIICPQGCCFDPESGFLSIEEGTCLNLNSYEIIISRNRKPLGLAMLRYAEVAGIPAINSHTATQQVRDKAKMAIALARAGVPCPPTYLAEDVSVLARLPKENFPLILKATYGDNSQGLRFIRKAEDLSDIHWGTDMVLAQHYLPNYGYDLKLYVCGRKVFAVRKPAPFNSDPNAASQQVHADGAMADLALKCGKTFGLDIYGVDTIETPDGLAVIEVNEFPNFTGIPGVADHIADDLLERITDQGDVYHENRISA